MSYKIRNKKTIACPIDFGVGYICHIHEKECIYRENRCECGFYQENFMTDEEKEKQRDKRLEMIVEALGLRKLNGERK